MRFFSLGRLPSVRPRVALSLFWIVLGVCATLAALLLLAVGTAVFRTEEYVVYRERIDLRDDAAQVSNQLMTDIRQLQADVLKLASVEEMERHDVARSLLEANDAEYQEDPSRSRSRYLEMGTFRYVPPGLGEGAPDRPTEIFQDNETYHREAAGRILLDAVPAAEWSRLPGRRNRVVTLPPQPVNVQLGPPPATADALYAKPGTRSSGPHWLLYSVCRISDGRISDGTDKATAGSESLPLPDATASESEPPGGNGEAGENAAADDAVMTSPAAGVAYAYVVMTINPRLKAIAEDPRHLTFLVHGTADKGNVSRADARWLYHPDPGYLFAAPAETAFGGVSRDWQTFTKFSSDEKLVRSALEAYRRKAETDPYARRVGIVLEGDEFDRLMLRDGRNRFYAQSHRLDEHVEKLVDEGRPFRTADLFAQRNDLAGVRATELAAELPQIRLLAGSKDQLEEAKQVIEEAVAPMIGAGTLKWYGTVPLDDYMLHVNALPYDSDDPDRFLALLQGVSVKEIENEVADAAVRLWLMVGGGVVLLAGVAVLLGDATRRLNRLSGVARGLSETDADADGWVTRLPELDGKLRTDRRDEVGVLSNTLAGLLDRLRAAQAELEKANAELEEKVREKTQSLEEESQAAEAARREAEQARQNLRFFVARVNHDIRNPLAILHGYADELRRMDVIRDNDLARRFVDSVRSAAALIELQVNDLDVATRLGDRDLLHEDFKIDRKRIDLRELIGGTVELMQKRATKNGDELVAVLDRRIERGEVPFVSDERRFRQILMNLLSNACKFTQQGRITVRAHVVAKSGEDWLQVEVEDTGRGMTPQQVEGLFKPFRCATAAEGNESGTGLGLCICRNLASRLGGALELRRTAPGRGTVFLLELPLVAPASSPDGREEEAIPRQEAAALSEVKNVEGDGRAPRELLGRGRSVLVIDDEREILELIRDHLERRGFMVWTAATAEQALRLVREYRPDAITLDVLLPGSRMSGWDVLTKLKSDPETAGIPVVMVTITEDRSRGFALGAADFVSKPVDPDRLVETVLAVCGSSAPGRLLVVEDDAEQRQAIADRLRREGWEVDEAADGLDGFKAAQRHTPEVILLDIIMPKWDGFDLAERLGREPTLRDVPIVVLTGKSLTRQEIERLNTRVQTILQKGSSGIDAALDEMLRRIVKTRREHPTPVAAGGER